MMSTQTDFTLVQTDDGSPTLYSSRFDEIYHSRKGALNESLHVYIRNGLERAKGEYLNVLEVGYGSGLNAVLAADYAHKSHRKINYQGFEKFPIDANMLNTLSQSFEQYAWYADWLAIAKSNWGQTHVLNDCFSYQKIEQAFEYVETSILFDVVFFDAFAPEKQPEIWEKSVFVKCAEVLKTGGLLTTYCCKSAVQRTMKEAGFQVEKVPGPIGKREMIVAYKI